MFKFEGRNKIKMKENKDIYRLDKTVWTHDDFEEMGWHDNTIYGMSFEKMSDACTADLLFDIDYIFKWVHHDDKEEGNSFSFYISPSTLIFKETFELSIEIDTENYSIEGFEISDLILLKKEPNKIGTVTFYWSLILNSGVINFQSQGFSQVIRQSPLYTDRQCLKLEERGGVNFGRIPYSPDAMK